VGIPPLGYGIEAPQDRSEEVGGIGGDLDFLQQTGVVQQNDICMGAANVKPDDHAAFRLSF
jgi:hypothetical protein